MKVIKVAVGIVLALMLLLSPGAVGQRVILNRDGLGNAFSVESIAVATRGLTTATDPIYFAVSTDVERWPAAAHGGDANVVVYVKKDKQGNDAIYASVLSSGQTDPLPYPISSFAGNCAHPAIAYQAASGWFVIVYVCDATAILAQVFQPATEVVGPIVTISADDGTPNADPAVVCNQTAGACLVAFQYDLSRVKGAYVDVDSAGITHISSVYDLSDGIVTGRPYLAWGREMGTYLVAYSEQHSAGEILPGYTHVIDQDDPLVTIKYLHPSTPAVPSDFSPSGYDALVSDAVFDPCTQKFLISFDYDAAGDGSNFDVWATVVHPTDPINFTPIPIADTPVSEHNSAISFVSSGHQTPSCGSMDRLLIGYINEVLGLMAVELRGDSNPSNPVYTYDAANQHLLIENHTNMYHINEVRIAHGPGDKRYMLVYDIHHLSSGDEDIWGKFIGLLDLVYLPLVLR